MGCTCAYWKRLQMKNHAISMFIQFLLIFSIVHFTYAQDPGLPKLQADIDYDDAHVEVQKEINFNTSNLRHKGAKWNGGGYHVQFTHAFVKAIMVIIVSEIGDKTFFIAAIFAMKHARSTVFAGAIGALGLMTFLSVALGYATTIIPRSLTYYGSVGLFLVFGLKMLHEGISMNPQGAQEEIEEVQAELKKKDEEVLKTLEKASQVVTDVEAGVIRIANLRRIMGIFSPILIQSFTLTFLAEWGDRSQITTIVLAASEDPFGVFIGAVIGHALCTGLAVIGGRMVAQRISVRTVTIVGGVFFLLNAVFSLFTGPA